MNYIMQLIAAIMEVIPGFRNARVYRMAAQMVAFVEGDVLGNRARHLINVLRMMMDEWVSQIEVVDYKLAFQREAYKMCYAWGKLRGYLGQEGEFLLDANGDQFLSRDDFLYRVQSERVRLAAADKGVQKLFHYMPGIGFVVKVDQSRKKRRKVSITHGHQIAHWVPVIKKAIYSFERDTVMAHTYWRLDVPLPITSEGWVEEEETESWLNVCFRLRAIKIALAFLQVDVDGVPRHTALFDVNSDRLPMLTEADMELNCFDREDQNFIERVGRAMAQKGHAMYKGEDGVAHFGPDDDDAGASSGIQAAHDMDFNTMDRAANAYSWGIVSKINLACAGLQWPKCIMGDFDTHALYAEADEDGRLPYWAFKSLEFRDAMGPQRTWVDKTKSKKGKNPKRHQYHTLAQWQIVTDPTTLKLHAQLEIGDEVLPPRIDIRYTSTGKPFTTNRCIYDEDMTRWFRQHNRTAFSVSRPVKTERGTYVWVALFYRDTRMRSQQERAKHDNTWDNFQIHQVWKTRDWADCIDVEKIEDCVHLSIQVEGDLKAQVIEHLGITLRQIGVKPNGKPLFIPQQIRTINVIDPKSTERYAQVLRHRLDGLT